MTYLKHEDWLGRFVEARTVQGDVVAIGKIITYSDKPTFSIEGQDGRRFSWVAELCRIADGWMTLDELRPGAIFETPDGTLSAKSNGSNGDGGPGWNCIMLENGMEITVLGSQIVREVKLPGREAVQP